MRYLKKYYVISVGDDPGDEHCRGPFPTFVDVMKNLQGYSYYLTNPNGPSLYKDMIGFHGQISDVYIVWGDDLINPSYKNFILPRLRKK